MQSISPVFYKGSLTSLHMWVLGTSHTYTGSFSLSSFWRSHLDSVNILIYQCWYQFNMFIAVTQCCFMLCVFDKQSRIRQEIKDSTIMYSAIMRVLLVTMLLLGVDGSSFVRKANVDAWVNRKYRQYSAGLQPLIWILSHYQRLNVSTCTRSLLSWANTENIHRWRKHSHR